MSEERPEIESGGVIAQANIARFRWPLSDPRMAEFTDRIDEFNELAARSAGFVWRFTDPEGRVDEFFGAPNVFFNMSVWRSVEDLHRFVYHSVHAEVLPRRMEWVEPFDGLAAAVIWPIEENHRPGLEEARERLSTLRKV